MSEGKAPIAILRTNPGNGLNELILSFSADGHGEPVNAIELHGYASSAFSGFGNPVLNAYKPGIREVEETLKVMRKLARAICKHWTEFGYGDMAAAAVVAAKVLGCKELRYFPVKPGTGEHGRHAGYTQVRDLGEAMRHAMGELVALHEVQKAA